MPSFISKAMKLRILAGNVPAWMRGHIRSDYIIKCYLSAPLWVHTRDFNALREEAKQLTEATGRKHVLDHKIPVTHTGVCGLTVPWNIRVIPEGPNAAKSNKWHPDQMEFYLAPRDVEQLSLWDEETRQRESGMNAKQRRRAEVKRIRSEGYWAAIHRKPRGNNPYTETQDMAQWDIGYQSGVDEIAQDEARIYPAIAAGVDLPVADVARDFLRLNPNAGLRACEQATRADKFQRHELPNGDAPRTPQDALGSTITTRTLHIPDYTIPGT